MTSKDLNSINEAFVKATTKVVAEGTEKPEERVTEQFKDKASGTQFGPNDPDDPFNKDKKKDKDKKKKVKEDLGPVGRDPADYGDEPLDDDWTPEKGDTVEVEHPGSDKKVGTIVGIVDPDKRDEDVPVKYNIEFPDGSSAVHPKDHIVLDEPSEDEPGPDAEDDAGDSGEDPWNIETSKVNNIMAEFEDMLCSSRYKVREKTEATKDFKKPDESVSGVDKKTQRPKGEVDAEDVDASTENVEDDLQEPVEADKKDAKKEKKVSKESINNSNKGNIMSEDKSIFDKLYEQVMSEDDDFELGLPGDDVGLDVGDELGDEGGEDVTVTLSPDQVDALKAVVDQFPSGDDDLEDELGLGDDEPVEDESF